MRFRRREPLFSVLLGTGLHLLNSLWQRLPEAMDDVKDRVGDTYETASGRVSRASAALRGEDESQLLGKGIALLIGVGIGVGIGLLIAPVSGEETREEITEKVSEFKDKVRERTGKKQQSVGVAGTDRE